MEELEKLVRTSQIFLGLQRYTCTALHSQVSKTVLLSSLTQTWPASTTLGTEAAVPN